MAYASPNNSNNIDRNANSANRQRRNWQRARQGALTNTIRTAAPITNSSTIGLAFFTSTGLGLVSNSLALLFADQSITGSASGIKVVEQVGGGISTGVGGVAVDNTVVRTTRLINTTAPLAGGGNLSADRTLSIPQATSTVNGFLSSTDWTTFNNKSSTTGTVTSVALTVPPILNVGGSPITTSGTLAVTLANQASTLVFAGPSTGAAAAPTFRVLTSNDLPIIAGDSSVTIGASAGSTTISANLPTVYGMKNRIMNGGFRLWQRGPSFPGTTAGYTADRWRFNAPGGFWILSRNVAPVGTIGGNVLAKYYLNYQTLSGVISTAPLFEQRIEHVETLAGVSASLSFYAKQFSGVPTLTMTLVQNFGTGGSPSAAVSTAIGSAILSSTWSQFGAQISIPSIAGKTLGTNDDDYVSLVFGFPSTGSYQGGITLIQLEPGGSVTEFEYRPDSIERDLCYRYFCKTYDDEIAPGTSIASNGALGATASSTAVQGLTANFKYPVNMRAAPTATIYSFTGVAGKITAQGGAEIAAAFLDVGKSGLGIYNNATAVAGLQYFWHVACDAEL